jgi:hypothetical protein
MKHGESRRGQRTHLWKSWRKMRERAKRYEGYEHVTVYDKWNDFETFRNWALNNGYEEGLSLDRINNDEGYYPHNCRWIPREKQNSNRRTNIMIEYKGETKCIQEWEREYDMPRGLLRQRIQRGWDLEKAFNKPSERGGKNA